MRLLFVTARWDPKDPDSGSGVNYNAYTALKKYGHDIKIAGPFESHLTFLERVIQKTANYFTNKRLIKFYPSYIKKSNESVQKIINDYKPDAVFSKASIPLVNVNLTIPFIYLCDSSVEWVKNYWKKFTKIGYWVMQRWEKKVIEKASHIITFSHENAEILKSYYKKPTQQITVHPIASALPFNLSGYERKIIGNDEKLNLLLVGTRYKIKGVDIAIKATKILNELGIKSELRIVGQRGESTENITFLGYFSKKNPEELINYINNYKWAHFQIFPSRFDAAGIAPSEAAQFGVPTITNAAGGLATTVKDGISGIVLERNSSAFSYAEIIRTYYENPEKYYHLCQTAYERYKSELNWNVFGKLLSDIIIETSKKQSE